MRTSVEPVRESLKVFTDAPSRYTVLNTGFLDFDTNCNVIVERRVRELNLDHLAQTRLSIRCMFDGYRRFETDDGSFVVDEKSYLIFNGGHRITSTLQSKSPSECFNITFKPGFAEGILNSLVTSSDRLLDDPFHNKAGPVSFFARTYSHGDRLSSRIHNLRNALRTAPLPHTQLEEEFHGLVVAMLETHRNVISEVESLSAVRLSTRVESYRRLHRSRDFIHANLEKPLPLEEIAREACLAPHHFLRLFKSVFHVTPHQYLTSQRLERARYLLQKTDMQVTEICMSVGFESLGSFSWLFRKHFGYPPSSLRKFSR